jgi:transcriptional regulator with XRE-family HTH domain
VPRITLPPQELTPLSNGIRRALKASGLTRVELARRVSAATGESFSPSTLHSWMNNGPVKPEKLRQFARATGVSVEELEAGLPNIFDAV